ncbi:hypothetical protein QUB68_01170 [Microcoleus sp. A006_D1]|uniref:hypothetical protein n=1 Tax=Microcoleus sp. A006_D1 TaxID=3055267 RepID=UPI002FD3C829
MPADRILKLYVNSQFCDRHQGTVNVLAKSLPLAVSSQHQWSVTNETNYRLLTADKN